MKNKEQVNKKGLKKLSKSPQNERLSLMITIVDRHTYTTYVKAFENYDVTTQFTLFGQGTANSEIMDYLGIASLEKDVILSIIKNSQISLLDKYVNEEITLNKKGISFIIPLKKLIGLSSYKFITKNIKEEEAIMENNIPLNENQYEAIICIVNSGFTDEVMHLAKTNGARGGTIITGRGTGNKEAEDFFGIVIQPEKEIVLIVVKKENVEDILTSIYTKVGLATPGHGIAFSLPVSHVMGIITEDINFKKEN